MKKCSECNVDMVEDLNLHTDYVGGVSFEEQIFVNYKTGKMIKSIFGNNTEEQIAKRVMARACPNCGKVELYIDLKKDF